MSKYLGDVSAYAYAVSKGYTGTEEEFAELMASYATVAEAAEASAQSAASSASAASGSASTASTAAQTATTKASEAAQSATGAQQSATQAEIAKTSAQASAQTATTKASEASQSATNAAGSATTANDAADDATAAKTAAETAKTAAETAKTDAETAQTAAETAAASVSASAAQIATNTADITDLKNALELQPYDYSEAWSMGGLNEATETEATTRIRTTYIPLNKFCKITISVESGYQYSVTYFDSSKNYEYVTPSWITTATEIDGSGAEYIRVVMRNENDTTLSVDDSSNINISILSPMAGIGSEIDSLRFGGYYYLPFVWLSNGYIDNTTGNVIAYNNWKYTDYIDISASANGILRVSTTEISSSFAKYCAWYDSSKSFIAGFTIINGDIEIPANASYIRLSRRNSSAVTIQLYAYGTSAIKLNNGGDPVSNKEYLKIATWNVGMFGNGMTHPTAQEAPTQIAKIKKAVGKMNADILNTQEFSDYVDSDHEYPTSNILSYKYDSKLYKGANKSFSKLITSNKEEITFTSGSDRTCFAYTVVFNGKTITVINAHLSIESSPTYRTADIAQLIAYMNTKDYVILLGDLNISSDAELDPFITAGYTLCNGGEFGWFNTWPVFDNMPSGWSTNWPCYHLDNIIVSSNIIPQYVEAVECDISDHAPLIAELRIN